MHNIAPLYYRYVCQIANELVQLITHNTRFTQTIKIKVRNGKLGCCIFSTKRKGGAAHSVCAAGTPGQPTGKRSFTAAQVTYQLNGFTAAQVAAERFGELLGLCGAGGFGLPDHADTHIPHILPRLQQQQQAQADGLAPC